MSSAPITASTISAVEYPELVQQYRVTGVPKTVINDRVEVLGAVPEDEFVRQVWDALETAP